jgi:two-component system cell cycle response regulator
MDRAPIRAKILVVDDEPQISEYEGALLAELGHEVLTAGNGAEAVRVAREQQPDLLLLDIMMPEMSGIEVCQQLRADPRTRDIRIIVVSGLDSKRALEESIIAGADDFLAKPIHALELMVRVRSMLRVRHIADEEKRLEAYVKNLQAMRRAEQPAHQETTSRP